MKPSISIIIPCYGQAHYLPAAIESALGQSVPPLEIVVVDDGSPDESAAVAQQYVGRSAATEVRVVRKANAGLSAARNTGILASRGELLIFLDSDDLLAPQTVERHAAEADAHPEADVFFTDYHSIDAEGNVAGPTVTTGFFPGEGEVHGLLRGSFYPPHAGMVRRRAIANVGLFDVRLRSYEDWDFWLRLAAAGSRFCKTEGVDMPYRQYPGSMSKNLQRMFLTGMQVLSKAELQHPGCGRCRRLVANTRWGLRRNFLGKWRRAGADRPEARLAFWKAVYGDPKLLLADLREFAQRTKWRLAERVAPDAARRRLTPDEAPARLGDA